MAVAAASAAALRPSRCARAAAVSRTRRPASSSGAEDEPVGSILSQLAEYDEDEELEFELSSGFSEIDEAGAADLDAQLQNFRSELSRKAAAKQEWHEKALSNGRRVGHQPVLLYTAIDLLFPVHHWNEDFTFDGTYVDGTFGRGGHSRPMLERLSSAGRLVGFDVDPSAMRYARELQWEDSRFKFIHDSFATLGKHLGDTKARGILLDIGVSSPQLDEQGRGFSLQNLNRRDGPLDLRMNPTVGKSAAEWLTEATVEELAWVIRKYGPDNVQPLMADRVAQAIMDDQEANGPFTMRRFAEVAAKVNLDEEEQEEFEHPFIGALHPAKLTVQALRLFLNSELEQLADGLAAAFDQLEFGGRCVVAAFKRREMEVVKRFLLEHEEPTPSAMANLPNRRLRELYPLAGTDLDYCVRAVSRPIRASGAEVNQNYRARTGAIIGLEKLPRTCKQVKVRPRLERNRFREPASRPPLIGEDA